MNQNLRRMPNPLARLRKKRAEDAETIRTLRSKIFTAEENAKNLEYRLKRIVTGTATGDQTNHMLTLCIKVDKRVLKASPHVLDDAFRQLSEDLMKAVQ